MSVSNLWTLDHYASPGISSPFSRRRTTCVRRQRRPEIAYRIERFRKDLEGRHTHCKQSERQASNTSGSSRCGVPPLGLSYGGHWFEKHAVARHRRVGALTAVEAAGRPLSCPEFRERFFDPDRARVTD